MIWCLWLLQAWTRHPLLLPPPLLLLRLLPLRPRPQPRHQRPTIRSRPPPRRRRHRRPLSPPLLRWHPPQPPPRTLVAEPVAAAGAPSVCCRRRRHRTSPRPRHRRLWQQRGRGTPLVPTPPPPAPRHLRRLPAPQLQATPLQTRGQRSAMWNTMLARRPKACLTPSPPAVQRRLLQLLCPPPSLLVVPPLCRQHQLDWTRLMLSWCCHQDRQQRSLGQTCFRQPRLRPRNPCVPMMATQVGVRSTPLDEAACASGVEGVLQSMWWHEL